MGAIKAINHICTNFERAFNVAGSLPFISMFSGAARSNLGAIQCVAGLALVAIAAIALAVEKARKHPDPRSMQKFDIMRQYGLQHAMHGALNVLRGTGEAFLGYTTLGFVNAIVLLPYNLDSDPMFSPEYRYTMPTSTASVRFRAHYNSH